MGGTTHLENRPLRPNDTKSVDSNLHELTVCSSSAESDNHKATEKQGVWSIEKASWKEVPTQYLHLPTKVCSPTPIISPSSFGLDMATLLDRRQQEEGTKTSDSDLTLIPLLPTPDDADADADDDDANHADNGGGCGGGGVDEDLNHNQNLTELSSPRRSASSEKQEVSKVVEAHTVILAARSRRLQAMLTSGMRESREGRVVMESMSHDILLELVHYLYSDNVSTKALNDPNMLMRLLVVASEYTLARLAKMCEGVLLRLLHPENAAEFLEFADMYGSTSILREGALSFLLRNYEEVKKTDGFLELQEELKKEVERRRGGTNVYNNTGVFPVDAHATSATSSKDGD